MNRMRKTLKAAGHLLLLSLLLLPAAAARSATHQVTVKNFTFEPNDITIAVGDIVRFLVTSDNRTITGTGSHEFCGTQHFFSGEVCEVEFPDAGEFPYRDTSRGALGGTGIVRVTENVLPVLTFTNLTDGMEFVFPTDVAIEVISTDEDGSIANVEFLVNSNSLAIVTGAQAAGDIFSFNADATNFLVGTNTIDAIATDDRSGRSTNSLSVIMVENSAPTVEFTNPADDATFSGPLLINLAATASDPDRDAGREASIALVEFIAGGVTDTVLNPDPANTAFASSQFTLAANQIHELTVIAEDDMGARTTNSISITVTGSIQMSEPGSSGNAFSFTVNTIPDLQYEIQKTTNLVDWLTVLTFSTPETNQTLLLPTDSESAGFFRIRREQ